MPMTSSAIPGYLLRDTTKLVPKAVATSPGSAGRAREFWPAAAGHFLAADPGLAQGGGVGSPVGRPIPLGDHLIGWSVPSHPAVGRTKRTAATTRSPSLPMESSQAGSLRSPAYHPSMTGAGIGELARA